MFLKFPLLFCLLFFSLTPGESSERPIEFVIVIPSYNNEQWCIKNLQSVVNQTYPHWSIYYINDCSTDRTGELIERFVKENGLKNRCTIVHNKTRRGAMANYYSGIQKCTPKKVVATLDGDDRLAHSRVLEILSRVYADSRVWITHGNYTTEPHTLASYCRAYPQAIMEQNSFRKYRWFGCQLRTFYAKLFHLIKKEDLIYQGDFFTMASDLAFMYPILEMSSRNHIRFIEEPIYIVNTANPISDRRKNKFLQRDLDKYIRSKQPYAPLTTLF